MTDLFLPPSLNVARVRFSNLESTGISRNPYNGGVRTADRGGSRLGASLEFTPAGGASSTERSRRRQLLSTVSRLTRANRIYLYDPGYTPSGSFPATELLTNNDFSNGTNGYGVGSSSSISVTDNVLRITRTGNVAGGAYASVTSAAQVQYAPYALRAMITTIVGGANPGPTGGTGTVSISSVDTGATPALRTTVLSATTGTAPSLFLDNVSPTGYIAGNYFEVSWCSYSRCPLGDAGPNSLTYSDQIDNAAWLKARCSVVANTTSAPDGTSTAEGIIEDSTAASTHGFTPSVNITVSSSAADYVYCAVLKANTRTWAYINIVETTGSSAATAWFNLGTGAKGTVTVGANWSNGRSFISDLGNGWYACYLVARKTNAATALSPQVFLTTGDNVSTYSGDGASSIYAWRQSLAQSSVPVRLVQTTSSATSGASQTGTTLYVKGGPASAAGSLLMGDWIEVITSLGSQLTMVQASVDFDAAGLGVISVFPPIRGTVADNAAIIVNKPCGKFVIASDMSWLTEPGLFTTASADFEEAPA